MRASAARELARCDDSTIRQVLNRLADQDPGLQR